MLKPTTHLHRCALVIGVCYAMAASHADAQSNARQHFGKVHFPIACSDGVQEQFDLALAMLHTFSFPDAAKTFTAVAQKDPDCAMAYWGIAASAIISRRSKCFTQVLTSSITQRVCVPTPVLSSNSIVSIPTTARRRSFMP